MRGIKSFVSWLIDQIIEHWAQIVFIGGSALMTYFASAAHWLNSYGPVAWGAVGLVTYLMLCIGYAGYGYAKSKIAMSDYAQRKLEATDTNVLAPTHNHERIELSQFYHPYYLPTENTRFENCDLFGP